MGGATFPNCVIVVAKSCTPSFVILYSFDTRARLAARTSMRNMLQGMLRGMLQHASKARGAHLDEEH
eukprot:1178475-Prorocentrum_minimum.AAC.1